MNRGWLTPPPSRPVKTDEDLRREREAKIGELERGGLLRSERLRRAMLAVRREDFIPSRYRDHAYEEIPLPLPGDRATISCPHSYPLFYEPLGLGEGHRFLEVGVGSGYGTAPLIDQIAAGGRLIAPVMEGGRQRLILLEQTADGVRRKRLADVLYVSLRGRFGVRGDRDD
jgi:protein-L-isoaspartate O-methyltransferase